MMHENDEIGLQNLEISYPNLSITRNCDSKIGDGNSIKSLLLNWGNLSMAEEEEAVARQIFEDPPKEFDVVWKLQSLQKLRFHEFPHRSMYPASKNNTRKSTKNGSTTGDRLGNLSATMEDLTLSWCRALVTIPPDIGLLINLTKLQIMNCRSLEYLPSELGLLTKLEELRIVGNELLQFIPTEIGNLSALKDLTISACGMLKHLPNEIGKLKSLRYLDVSCCQKLEYLPPNIGNLKGLQEMRICFNHILTTIPSEIGNLTNLRELVISGWGFVDLPPEIGKLSDLQGLAIFSCRKLAQLPSEIGYLNNLKKLEIRANDLLQSIPPEIERKSLSSLKELIISEIPLLETFPAEIGNIESLENLVISSCPGLESLPQEMGHLQMLQKLVISSCRRLESVPSEIGCLTELQELSVIFCINLVYLPAELGNLRSLEKLQICTCHSLRAIPNEIGQLSDSLQFLEIRGNRGLSTLPAEIGHLERLETLRLIKLPSLRSLPVGFFSSLYSLKWFGLGYCPSLTSFTIDPDFIHQEDSNINTSNTHHTSSPIRRPLQYLETFTISRCPRLERLPTLGIQTLPRLKTLTLGDLPVTTILDFFSAPWAARNLDESSTPTTTTTTSLTDNCSCTGITIRFDGNQVGRSLSQSDYATIWRGLPRSLETLAVHSFDIEYLTVFLNDEEKAQHGTSGMNTSTRSTRAEWSSSSPSLLSPPSSYYLLPRGIQCVDLHNNPIRIDNNNNKCNQDAIVMLLEKYPLLDKILVDDFRLNDINICNPTIPSTTASSPPPSSLDLFTAESIFLLYRNRFRQKLMLTAPSSNVANNNNDDNNSDNNRQDTPAETTTTTTTTIITQNGRQASAYSLPWSASSLYSSSLLLSLWPLVLEKVKKEIQRDIKHHDSVDRITVSILYAFLCDGPLGAALREGGANR